MYSPITPGSPQSMGLSVYTDIAQLFHQIREEFNKYGSYFYETRKRSYIDYCNYIINTANQIACSHFVPVRTPHSNLWIEAITPLESQKIKAISNQIQYYISNFWDSLQYIDGTLAKSIFDFRNSLEIEVGYYSMRHLLQIYVKEMPVLTADPSIQNTIQCYLMMNELETEIKRTWLYKLFPKMKSFGYGNSISSIRDKLQYQLRNLETFEGYTRLNSQLIFGKIYTFMDMNQNSIVDAIVLVPSAVIRALAQVEVICPTDVRPFVTNCKNYFETLEYSIATNPEEVAFCQEIKSYYVDSMRLRSQFFTVEEFKYICGNLVNFQKKMERNIYYRELADCLKQEIGELISIYERRQKRY